MGAIFSNAPTEPTAAAIQVGKIYFEALGEYCRSGRPATTNIRPVDSIGRPMANLDVYGAHADELVQRARAKGLAVSRW